MYIFLPSERHVKHRGAKLGFIFYIAPVGCRVRETLLEYFASNIFSLLHKNFRDSRP